MLLSRKKIHDICTIQQIKHVLLFICIFRGRFQGIRYTKLKGKRNYTPPISLHKTVGNKHIRLILGTEGDQPVCDLMWKLYTFQLTLDHSGACKACWGSKSNVTLWIAYSNCHCNLQLGGNLTAVFLHTWDTPLLHTVTVHEFPSILWRDSALFHLHHLNKFIWPLSIL